MSGLGIDMGGHVFVRRAADAEEHQRVPPEIAEPGVEFGKH